MPISRRSYSFKDKRGDWKSNRDITSHRWGKSGYVQKSIVAYKQPKVTPVRKTRFNRKRLAGASAAAAAAAILSIPLLPEEAALGTGLALRAAGRAASRAVVKRLAKKALKRGARKFGRRITSKFTSRRVRNSKLNQAFELAKREFRDPHSGYIPLGKTQGYNKVPYRSSLASTSPYRRFY